MNNTSINKQKNSANKVKSVKSILILIVAAAISIVCLTFFFHTLLSYSNTESEPKIFDLKQIAATDTSMLISWNCTEQADEYIIECIGDDGKCIAVSYSDIPFAAIRKMDLNTKCTVGVTPVKNGIDYETASLTCSTEAYCAVTEINITKVTDSAVTLSWKYSGIDKGFVAIAYVLDIDGMRHLTSKKVEIASGINQCKINGLLSNMNYTVVVMPKTNYNKAKKSNFTTAINYNSYSKLNIIHSVICSENSTDSPQVNKLISIRPDSTYKMSILFNGDASVEDTVDIAIYIKDTKGNLVSGKKYNDIHTNPEGKEGYLDRVILLSFNSPKKRGEYLACITIDGEIASRIPFDTMSEL